MSLSKTKEQLIKLLSEPENKVIALSGKWGTGKSHLWNDVKKASTDEKVIEALYVSLFGLSSIDQIKLKIVQSAIPYLEKDSVWRVRIQKTWQATTKALEGVHKGFAVLNDIALLAVPSFLKEKLIVLDDIERKHEKLSVDEVMGFIDEFTKQHGARIVLILNSDQLKDRDLWDILREKVIDEEVKLKTSPAEAFQIAQGIAPSPYAQTLAEAIGHCGITNIRIICKIIRAVNRILGNRSDLSDDMLARVIPSTVLLTAIHYRGIEDGPDFDFVLKASIADKFGLFEKAPVVGDEEAKRKAKWKTLLRKLEIHVCDDYEHLVVEFLESGLFEMAEVENIIGRYASEHQRMHANRLARELRENIFWNHQMTDAQFVAEAQALVDQSSLLDAANITNLYEMVSKIPGGAPVVDEMIRKWIVAFKAQSIDFGNSDAFDDRFRQHVHPLIKEAIDSKKTESRAKTTVLEACVHIAGNGDWGSDKITAINSTSIHDFERTIKSLSPNDLKPFMYSFINMIVQRRAYEMFCVGIDNFIEACRNIYTDQNSGRLGTLIKMLFDEANHGALLEPSAQENVPSVVRAQT